MAKRRKKTMHKEMRSQVKGILLLALAAFCYVGLIRTEQAGGIGLYLNTILRTLAGEAAFVIPIMITFLAVRFILPPDRQIIKTRLGGLLALPFIYMTWVHLRLISERLINTAQGDLFFASILIGLEREGGGVIGAFFAGALNYLFGAIGSHIIIAATALISLLMVLNISIKGFLKKSLHLTGNFISLLKTVGRTFLNLFSRTAAASRAGLERLVAKRSVALDRIKADSGYDNETPIESAAPEDETSRDAVAVMPSDYQKERMIKFSEPVKDDEQYTAPGVMSATAGFKHKPAVKYIYPPLTLLSLPRTNGEQQHLRSSRNRAKLLENTLLSFGVKAKVVHVQSGPTVTRFEVQPEAGVKVSKIISLSDDLALNLAAPLVRIEAPIPGKAALGIEVPNKVIALVHLREVMEDDAFQKSVSPLTVGLGKDITGIPVIADLTKMPHLLIAGATGAGKSVCLNTIITSILYKADPEKVRFLMIDPKVVELSIYNGIPHLLMPVLTDPRKASLALRNMVREMARRYDLFASLGVRDIGSYNELAAEERELDKMPFIVVVIDELADMMLVSPGEVEDSIARLAQMSRAAGIHLLVATQRPSVDVLTGIIKANITSRVAFTVSSQFDSRTILDMAGAEKLLGSGDMLFYPVGAVKPFRVQGAYVSEGELKRVTDFLKEQGLIEYENSSTFMETSDETEEEVDTLFAEAVDLVVRTGQASISLLQRRFRIGYTRAARLIDDLERRGIVGPFEGSKPREVLITADQAVQICEDYNRKHN